MGCEVLANIYIGPFKVKFCIPGKNPEENAPEGRMVPAWMDAAEMMCSQCCYKELADGTSDYPKSSSLFFVISDDCSIPLAADTSSCNCSDPVDFDFVNEGTV